MQRYQLGEFLQEFLARHGLGEFSLSLEPVRRGSRRAKRSNTLISAKDPQQGPTLAKSRSVLEMFNRLYALAPEIGVWIQDRQYKPQLLDDVGVRMKDDALLGDLRKRAALRTEEGERKSRKILLMAIQSCDRLLDPEGVNQLIADILEEREGE